jgi:Bacterial protein of unknown function (DUF899)
MKETVLGAPKVVDRATFQAELDALRVREKAHTREGEAIAAARRRLPMVEVDGAAALMGERGASSSWPTTSCGTPAARRRRCTWFTSQVRELCCSRRHPYLTVHQQGELPTCSRRLLSWRAWRSLSSKPASSRASQGCNRDARLCGGRRLWSRLRPLATEEWKHMRRPSLKSTSIRV